MTRITALIITLNEERHIADCVASLRPVADEVLVIDSFSTDQTKTVAEAQGAKVIEANFAGFGPQRNMGVGFAAHDLILVLDADERLSPELTKSILAVKENATADAYSFARLNYIGDRAIKTCGWYPDIHVRMYDRRKVKWNDRKVHEGLIVHGEVKLLQGDLLHYSYDNIAGLKRKSTRYAQLGSEVYKGRNAFFLMIQIVVSPVAKFIKTFILKKGFTDGYLGLVISYYRARETFLKYYWAL